VVRRCPVKIDIGAVFNAPPKMHKKVKSFTAMERELIIDVCVVWGKIILKKKVGVTIFKFFLTLSIDRSFAHAD